MFETDIGAPVTLPRFIPNRAHLKNRRRSNPSWQWVDATIIDSTPCIGPRGSDFWRVSYTWHAGSHGYTGQFWKGASSSSEAGPFDSGDQLQILIDPSKPENHYYPPAAGDAAVDVGVIVFAMGVGILVPIIGIWLGVSHK